MTMDNDERLLAQLTTELNERRRRLDEESSRRRTVEREVRRCAAEASTSFDHAPVMDVILDASGTIVKANLAALRFMGRSLYETVGTPFCQAFGCVHAGHIDCNDEGTMACRRCTARRATDDFATSRSAVLPFLTDARGRRHRLLVSSFPFHDRGERRQLVCLEHERVTSGRMRRLEQMFKVDCLGILANNVARDIASYVDDIASGVEGAIEACVPDDPVHEHLAAIETASRRAMVLADVLQTMAHVTSHPLEAVDVQAILDTLTRELRPQLPPSVTLDDVHPSCEASWSVEGDSVLLAEAVRHVLHNALEASEAGGTVVVRLKNVVVHGPSDDVAPGEYVRLTVQDAGPGLADDEANKLLEPFFSNGAGRTGLGLAAACLIARQQGGELVIAPPSSGPGTVVHLYFLHDLPAEQRSAPVIDEAGRLLAFAPVLAPSNGGHTATGAFVELQQ